MTDQRPPARSEIALGALLPNLLTIAAICAGLSSIRFAVQENYALAVLLILAAGVLDGIDGRLARLLGAQSRMGAELDSLADFLNFGVAPPLLLYLWALTDTPNEAWLAVLVYAICCVVRLARFNIASKSDDAAPALGYFVGVPAPGGALLVLLPMYLSFAFADGPILPDTAMALYMVAVGALMVSRIPTPSFKTARVPRRSVKYVLIGFAFAAAVLLTYLWISLVALCLGYAGAVFWSAVRSPAQVPPDDPEDPAP